MTCRSVGVSGGESAAAFGFTELYRDFPLVVYLCGSGSLGALIASYSCRAAAEQQTDTVRDQLVNIMEHQEVVENKNRAKREGILD